MTAGRGEAALLEVAGDQLDHPRLVVDHHHVHPLIVGRERDENVRASVIFGSLACRP